MFLSSPTSLRSLELLLTRFIVSDTNIKVFYANAGQEMLIAPWPHKLSVASLCNDVCRKSRYCHQTVEMASRETEKTKN